MNRAQALPWLLAAVTVVLTPAATIASQAPKSVRPAVERQIDAMSEEEQIGQLLFVGFEGARITPELRSMISEWHVGGVAEYRQNIESPDQLAQLNTGIRAAAAGHVEPFIAVDQEGGSVRRLREGVPDLPGAMALGAIRSAELSYRAGLALGTSLRLLGITMNFAPVLDVLSNPANTALGTRSFSDDPQLVASLGTAFARGEMRAGVIAVGKHFPGQGGTSGDSHYELPRLDAGVRELRERELVPFQKAIDGGLPAIMTAHVSVPRVAEAPDLPATLSRRILSDILRKQLGFDGVIITDELEMRGIAGNDPGEAAVRAVLAGADMVLVVWDGRDRQRVRHALETALRSGRISRDRLRTSLRRILRLKRQLAASSAAATDSGEVADEIARQSITVIAPDSRPLLLATLETVAIGADGAVRHSLGGGRYFPAPPRVDEQVVRRAMATVGDARQIVAIIATENDRRLIEELRKRLPKVRLVVVCLGPPQDIMKIAAPDAIVVAYSDVGASQKAAAQVLLGKEAAPGQLPLKSVQLHLRSR